MVRVAAIQASPVAYDLHKSMHKLRSLVFAAREGGAELVVMPEAFLSAYPRNLEFTIGARTAESREWYGRFVKSSVKIPDGAEGHDWLATAIEPRPDHEYWGFFQLAAISRKYSLYLSVGVVECASHGSTLWSTNLLFGPDGRLLARHRKIALEGAERVVWNQGDATNSSGVKRDASGEHKNPGTDNMSVVPTPIGRIGGLLGWENLMPLARYLLFKKGLEIYLAPTADSRPTWLPTVQHLAQEGRVFVVSANQVHGSSDFPDDYPPNARSHEGPIKGGDTLIPVQWSRGGSVIVGPLGEVLAGPLWDKEGVLYADIDINELHGAKLDFDPIGHHSREILLMDLLSKV